MTRIFLALVGEALLAAAGAAERAGRRWLRARRLRRERAARRA